MASSKSEAAEMAGITSRTLRDYFNDPEFTEEYTRAVSGAIQDAMRAAQLGLTPAIECLRGIIEDDFESSTTRISAARAMLEYGIKLTETGDILTRLDALEDADAT